MQKDSETKQITLKPGPKSAQLQRHAARNKRKPPRGMFLNGEDLKALATGPANQGDAILRQLEAEIVTLKRQVQNQKQSIGILKTKTSCGVESFKPPQVRTLHNPQFVTF